MTFLIIIYFNRIVLKWGWQGRALLGNCVARDRFHIRTRTSMLYFFNARVRIVGPGREYFH